MKRIEILENTVRKRQEKVRDLEKTMEHYKKSVERLENYALANHHKWNRKRLFEESQKLTDVCIELDKWEVKYNREKLELNRAKGRLKKAKEISKE